MERFHTKLKHNDSDTIHLVVTKPRERNVDDPNYVEGVVDFSKDENKVRGNWTGRMDFILACLGYVVGLGNVWRFPYLCYKNGGAVFFIPYVIMLFFVGMPIFFMEVALGQFTSSSPLTCWNMAKFFKGIGVGMVLVSFLVGIYYNMIIAWAIWYLFATLVNITNLPWQHCDGYYNTPLCSAHMKQGLNRSGCEDMGFEAETNGVCYNMSAANNTMDYIYGIWNTTLAEEHNTSAVLASVEYLDGRALGKMFATGVEDLGPVRMELAAALLLAWLFVFGSLSKGVKSTGKVAYITATFPYVVLFILLGRGLTLEGYFEGIKFYLLQADFSKLARADVWSDAAIQIFFSLSASWGGLIALSSFNRFHTDCLRDSLIVSLGNCLTSVLAGFVIFSFLGFLAHELHTTVDKVAESGVDLAFIVYPDAVTRMPLAGLWAVLFFLMLIMLGLGTEIVIVGTVTTSLFDEFEGMRERRGLTLVTCCSLSFICGLPLCTNGGAYVLQIMDFYSGGWNVLVIAFCECLCISYIYAFFGGPLIGASNRWKEDIRLMIGVSTCWLWDCTYVWWGLCWFFFTPVGVLFILTFSWYDYSEVTYGNYAYPAWAEGVGWMLTMTVVAGVLVTGIIQIVNQCRTGEPLKDLFRPNREWGPALIQHRRLMLRYVPKERVTLDPWEEKEKEENAMKAESTKECVVSVASLSGGSNRSTKEDSKMDSTSMQ